MAPNASLGRKRPRTSSGLAMSRKKKQTPSNNKNNNKNNNNQKKMVDVFANGTPIRKYFLSVILKDGTQTEARWYKGQVVQAIVEEENNVDDDYHRHHDQNGNDSSQLHRQQQQQYMYHIRYEDGDEEDMEHVEVHEAHLNYQRYLERQNNNNNNRSSPNGKNKDKSKTTTTTTTTQAKLNFLPNRLFHKKVDQTTKSKPHRVDTNNKKINTNKENNNSNNDDDDDDDNNIINNKKRGTRQKEGNGELPSKPTTIDDTSCTEISTMDSEDKDTSMEVDIQNDEDSGEEDEEEEEEYDSSEDGHEEEENEGDSATPKRRCRNLSTPSSSQRNNSVVSPSSRRSPYRAARKIQSYAEEQDVEEENDNDSGGEEEDEVVVPTAPRSQRCSQKDASKAMPTRKQVRKRQIELEDSDMEEEEEQEWEDDEAELPDDDDELEEDDLEDEEEEELYDDKPKRRKRVNVTNKKSNNPKIVGGRKKQQNPGASTTTTTPPTTWKLPSSDTHWDKTSVYDYDWEIPSDAEEEILQAAQSSQVSVKVARHTSTVLQMSDRQRQWASTKKKTTTTTTNASKQMSLDNKNNGQKRDRSKDESHEKSLYTAGNHLPVLSQPQQMFNDMIQHLLSLPDPFQLPNSKTTTAVAAGAFQYARSSSASQTKKDKQLTLVDRARHLFLPLLQTMRNRPLKVATMCSGTESPILALDMIQKSLEDVCHELGLEQDLMRDDNNDHDDNVHDSSLSSTSSILPIEHVFSCEIEPFKQAYIERNFRPPLLFRDIRELGQEEAYTAYGALAKVPNTPGSVDVLIAGTSCVDYSNLNNRKKTIAQKGESGQTFWGMIDWIDKAQPPIIIIENVRGAPWDAKVDIFTQRGYAATYKILDTKDYYIPHTRNRGYLFAVKQTKNNNNKGTIHSSIISNKGGKGKKTATTTTTKWSNLLGNLKRPASASLDAFMLPNDDARVLRGRARLTAESTDTTGAVEGDRAGRTDWTKCETRHQFARSSEELGEKRPLTGWSDSGNTVMPAFAWNEWTNAQVHRIHDLMDINTLRLAKGGIDCTYKTMVWNLSQNVDRDTMGKLGLCQCLTPTGVPYVTNRGGPLVGEELLLLQGIPADDLLFTKESEANLKDLAGNAMSTTVVGAVTLCALLLGHEALGSPNSKTARSTTSNSTSSSKLPACQSLVPRPLQQPTPNISIERVLGRHEKESIDLGPCEVEDWQQLLNDAHWSSRKCYSEGENESLPVESLVICDECGETCSREHAFPPRRYEEHDFKSIDTSTNQIVRKQPAVFRRELFRYLPMLVSVEGIELGNVEMPSGVKASLWKEWKEQVQLAISDSDGKICSFRFTRLERSRVWTAHYYSDTSEACLEARFHGKGPSGVTWFLFTKIPLIKGELRTWLENPVARMLVASPKAGRPHLLTLGHWELCLPIFDKVQLSIRGVGNVVNSWRSRLGLKGEFESERQFEKLQISLSSDDDKNTISLSSKISGTYKLLLKCGGACGSLMRKEGDDGNSMFLFTESGRKSLAETDVYVFADTCHRTSANEHREIELRVNRGFDPVFNGDDHTKFETLVAATTPGKWVEIPGSSLSTTAREGLPTSTEVSKPLEDPNGKIQVSMQGWKICAEIMACTVPVTKGNKALGICLRHDCVELNMVKSKGILESLAFLTSRLSIPDVLGVGESEWIALGRSGLEKSDGDDTLCDQCAPKRPFTQWTIVEKGKQKLYLPVEDGREAAVYEQLLKRRPRAWIIRLEKCSKSDRRSLRIGCNAVSLVQRAYGYFPRESQVRKSALELATSSDIQYEFRVVPHVDRATVRFETLRFSSNKLDEEAAQPKRFKFKLRKEQLRSLGWMLKQEESTVPFLEEEVTEEILPSLNWRAEGRVQRPVLVRGGIIADEVGYGKTAITLGLIDSAAHVPKPPEGFYQNLIPTKATLVIVPGHLMGQWPNEVKKFLGSSKRVVNLDDMRSIGNTSIGSIANADIVLASFKVLCNESYFRRLARLVGINPDSFPKGGKGGRLFDAVYGQCLSLLPDRVSHIKKDCKSLFDTIENDAKNLVDGGNNGHVRLDGKKAIYKADHDTSKGKLKAPTVEKGERNPWGLSSHMSSYERMKSPPLEAFFWNRIVVDEFTYLVDTERERVLTLLLGLKSSFRWCLSGTPQHANFNDIKTLGTLLGLHLGVDETLPGVKLGPGRGQRAQENTGLENLSQFLEVRSMQWHERRHKMAQSFMDRFVRQNVAEINEIPWEEPVYRLELPPAERAIYLELETHLKSLDMNSKNAQKSRKKSRGDRDNRMQKILRESQSAEEALLKACTHYDMDKTGTSASETMSDVIRIRKSELKRLEREIIEGVAACFRQHHRILAQQPDWNEATKVEKGEVASALNAYLSEVDESRSVSHGADKDVHDRIRILAKLAEAAFKTNPLQKDERFEEVNDVSDEKESSSKKKAEKKVEVLYGQKRALHNYMFTIRSFGKELCGRIRSLRFVEHVYALQESKQKFRCAKCNREDLSAEDVAILSSCGHFGCLKCLEACAAEGKCIEHPRCSADVSLPHVISSTRLNIKARDDSGGRYGCKLTAAVTKVKEIVESGDRVLVFIQFDDLKDKVAEALEDSNLTTIQVKGSVKHQVKSLSVFQKDTPSPGDPRVLLLKMDDEQSAGLNLTNLNHAVFVHPLLAGSQQQYDAYETQAIGRIRRYGQKKTVYIHRFLVKDTIDTEIYNERGGRNISHTTAGM